MRAFSAQRKDECGEKCDEGFTFAGGHFGELSVCENEAGMELAVVGRKRSCAPDGLGDEGDGARVKVGAVLAGVRFCAQCGGVLAKAGVAFVRECGEACACGGDFATRVATGKEAGEKCGQRAECVCAWRSRQALSLYSVVMSFLPTDLPSRPPFSK